MSGWAVVDVETTGLHPARDRVVELAIVRLDQDGQPIDEWSTLVNPEDRAPGRIHGLSARDLAGAPTFRDLADDVLYRLAGRVIVAHNAPFDVAFLQAETVRAGIAWGPVEGFCTMEVLYGLHIAHSRKLHVCCAELGVPAGTEHVALEDARAVAGLMRYLGPRLWTIEAPAPAPDWQRPIAPSAVAHRRARALNTETSTTPTHLARHVSVPPELGIPEAAGSTYLGLIDLIIEDGRVTDDEVDALSLFARACGIDREMGRRLNQAYLDEMSRLALADGILTEEERIHLGRLMALLGRALPR